MVCIVCGENTNVVNSRSQVRTNATWRRRKCSTCQAVFTTIESADLSSNWLVAKDGGILEPFLQEKLFLSIYESCRHRPTVIEDSKYLSMNVIGKLRPFVKSGVIKPESIAHIVGITLNRFDNASGVHYLAFHKLAKPNK
jgi:transcriptional regulator NrdR family protein